MFIFAPVRWTFRLIELVIVAIVVYLVVSGVQVALASRVSSNPASVGDAAAIVVFPAALNGDAPGPVLTARFEQALALYEDHKAPVIEVVSTPASSGTYGVGSVAQSWFVDNGVTTADVHELASSNNADALSQLASQDGRGTTLIVVADALDVLWTTSVGASDGLEIAVSPPSSTKKAVYSEIGPLFSQASGVALGRIVGFGRIRWLAG